MMSETDRRTTIETKLREVGALHETFAASQRGVAETMKVLDTQIGVLGNVFELVQTRQGEIRDLLLEPCEGEEEEDDGLGGGGG